MADDKKKPPAEQQTKRDEDRVSREKEQKTMPEDVSQQGSGTRSSSASSASSATGSTTHSTTKGMASSASSASGSTDQSAKTSTSTSNTRMSSESQAESSASNASGLTAQSSQSASSASRLTTVSATPSASSSSAATANSSSSQMSESVAQTPMKRATSEDEPKAKRAKEEDSEDSDEEEDRIVSNKKIVEFTPDEDDAGSLVSDSVEKTYTLKNGDVVRVTNLNFIHTVGGRKYRIDTTGTFGEGTKSVVLKLRPEDSSDPDSSTPELAMKHTSFVERHPWFKREIQILKHFVKLDAEKNKGVHEHVVVMLGYRRPKDLELEMSIFMEPLSCSIDTYFQRFAPRVPHFHIIRFVLKHVLDALQFIRRHGVLHLSINPTNFMVLESGMKNHAAPITAIKLINFDRAQLVEDEKHLNLTCQKFDDYTAPELEYNVKPHNNFEIYSVGLIAWRLLVGENVMKGASDEEQLMNMRELMGPVPLRYEQSKGAAVFETIKSLELEASRRCKKEPINIAQLKTYIPNVYASAATQEQSDAIGLIETDDYQRLVSFIEACLKWNSEERQSLEVAQKSPFMDTNNCYGTFYKGAANAILNGDGEVFIKYMFRETTGQ